MVIRTKSAMSSYDAFAKPMDGIRTRSEAGGIITLIASATAAILFLSQLYLYTQVEHRHSLHLSESLPVKTLTPTTGNSKQRNAMLNKIPLNVHVTFPYVKCTHLDYAHDGASKSSGAFKRIHGRDEFLMRTPTVEEFNKAAAMFPDDDDDNNNNKGKKKPTRNGGCTVKGMIYVPKVGGTLSITISANAWAMATSSMLFGGMFGADNGVANMMGRNSIVKESFEDVSHYIHSIEFGESYPHTPNPLSNSPHVINNDLGIGLSNIDVRLVQTKYKRFGRSPRDTFQASVAKHIVQPQTLAAQHSTMFPGMSLTYDFTPLTVHHVEHRENFAVFVSSLVSIVGGVFVTVGLVGGCLRSSAAAVSKKTD